MLVVEDDPQISSALALEIEHGGYETRIVEDGPAALALCREWSPDLVLLDLGLPTLDGIEVCRRIRSSSHTPILVLTARDSIQDRVKGLDAGADDYLSKPFSLEELMARVRSTLRRARMRDEGDVLTAGDIVLDARARVVTSEGEAIDLTPREFELLEFLMRNERLVVSRERLLDEVWGYDPMAATNTIDVFISNLRRKLEAGGEPRLLHTKRGAGYVLKD